MNVQELVALVREAGEGPGYWSPHVGRPGEVGGSAPRPNGGLTAEEKIDLSHLSPEDLKRLAIRGDEDLLLKEMCRIAGYDKTPRIVTKTEMDEAVAQGATEVWRGVGTGKYAEQFRSGPYWAGQGTHGNGTYTTDDKKMSASYSNYDEKALLRIAIPAAAKVITYAALCDEMRAERGALWGLPSEVALNDEGRYAVTKGYDVIHATSGRYVILNRGAVLVEEAQ